MYEFLARSLSGEGRQGQAMAELERYSSVGGRNPGTLKQLATLQTELGSKARSRDGAGAAEPDLSRRRSSAQEAGRRCIWTGQPGGAIREYQAVLAAEADRPGGRALSSWRARSGRQEDERGARRSVLRAGSRAWIQAGPETAAGTEREARKQSKNNRKNKPQYSNVHNHCSHPRLHRAEGPHRTIPGRT